MEIHRSRRSVVLLIKEQVTSTPTGQGGGGTQRRLEVSATGRFTERCNLNSKGAMPECMGFS